MGTPMAATTSQRRARPLAWLVLLAAAAAAVSQLVLLLHPRQSADLQAAAFVGVTPPRVRARPAQTLRRAEEEEEKEEEEDTNEPQWPPRIDKGIHLDGDNLDNLEEWYQEAITGPKANGGPPTGFMRDLVLRSYSGFFNKKGWHQFRKNYTGGWGIPLQEDYDKAFAKMKATAAEGKIYIGKDDFLGWLWLVAEQTPDGIILYYMKSPPYGQRPLALLKPGKEDEFWNSVDWQRLYIRLHKWNLWGKSVSKFPYPVSDPYYDEYKKKPAR